MHVVVCGAGYAGLTLTRTLESTLPDSVDLTLVDESPDHLVQHELHRVIRRPELADEIRVPLPAVCERAAVRVARVEAIDREARVISLSDGELEYDIAALCLGARTAYYGLEGVSEHGLPLKRLAHARRIRRRALEAIRGDDDGRLVVGGAGLSGVQVAGELAALADDEYGSATVTLLEQADAVAPGFSPDFQRAVDRTLADAGVEVRTGTGVVGADADAVSLESGECLESDAFVWTGGIRGPDAFEGERPTVEADLRIDERTFVLGDAARVVDADGKPVPASAQAAVREAEAVAANVERLVEADGTAGSGEDPQLESFSFDSPGWLVSVGDDAVARVGSTVVTGRAAKALKSTVGVGYLSSVGAVGNVTDRVSRRLWPDRSD
ncbi:NAD(P)/FAD-dependent oxidoreductase [Natronolimnohabitans innermongolicus]|uniref:FAD-dependent pyridine nucleotide-disulfide oxidoreductase n=1 Tax=Natronolimnohabitans innermongolicus JCM 12255 TaxID=1227499 RepID=L9XI46_9EURY|nr:FAD-dependent oxidoreductase [Natronolimnohabitans innermongolicus]ELY61066.1 FAD-dependent pyridine nucleotide-disulfide oxidoreductase [Natronolimnohabitans innermongolicus JCM 12255]